MKRDKHSQPRRDATGIPGRKQVTFTVRMQKTLQNELLALRKPGEVQSVFVRTAILNEIRRRQDERLVRAR